jgi:predicted membrane protein (TIGR00267 family)
VEDSSEDEQSQDSGGIFHSLGLYISEVGTYLKVTRAQQILRRYFAMNAFDGAMTSLGVVIGAYISHITDPESIISVIIVGGIAMMVSGFSGTYMTESAERNHSLNELEDAMLVDLEDTIYGRAGRFVSVFAAVVDGSAPFLASIPSVLPFILVNLGTISITTAFILSVAASLGTLFLLGVYLGRISGGNVFISGAKMVVAGVTVAILALLLGEA